MTDDESAEKIYRFVVADISPSEPSALAGLADIMEKQARWEELVEILPQVIDVTYEEEERLRLTSQLAHLFEEKLADIDNAVVQYTTVLEYNPYEADALERLAQIYQVQEKWAELFDVHERQKENAETDLEKAGLAAAMAQLAGAHLVRPDDAIDLWNEVLSLRGEDMGPCVPWRGL